MGRGESFDFPAPRWVMPMGTPACVPVAGEGSPGSRPGRVAPAFDGFPLVEEGATRPSCRDTPPHKDAQFPPPPNSLFLSSLLPIKLDTTPTTPSIEHPSTQQPSIHPSNNHDASVGVASTQPNPYPGGQSGLQDSKYASRPVSLACWSILASNMLTSQAPWACAIVAVVSVFFTVSIMLVVSPPPSKPSIQTVCRLQQSNLLTLYKRNRPDRIIYVPVMRTVRYPRVGSNRFASHLFRSSTGQLAYKKPGSRQNPVDVDRRGRR